MTYSVSEELNMQDSIRVVMTSKQGNPTRDELNTVDRIIGETKLAGLPLEWSGWIVDTDTMKLSCQWILPSEYVEEVLELIELDQLVSHNFSVYLIDDEEAEEIKLM